MRRLRVLGMLICLLASGPEVARAQNQYLYWSSGDSIAILPGASANVVISMYTYAPSIPPSYYCTTLTAYDVTLLFDPANVQVASAATFNDYTVFGTPTLTLAPGQARIAATGSTGYPYYCYVALVQVRFTLDPASTQGSVVTFQGNTANTLTGYFGESLLPGLTTYPLRICHATKVWGDLDGNGSATSRDALIALSAAVGLDVSMFPEVGLANTVGDVDDDGIISSRDALYILSAGLGSTDSRAGAGIADACPSLGGAPPALLTRVRDVTR